MRATRATRREAHEGVTTTRSVTGNEGGDHEDHEGSNNEDHEGGDHEDNEGNGQRG
jgi:hypothetical protein